METVEECRTALVPQHLVDQNVEMQTTVQSSCEEYEGDLELPNAVDLSGKKTLIIIVWIYLFISQLVFNRRIRKYQSKNPYKSLGPQKQQKDL